MSEVAIIECMAPTAADREALAACRYDPAELTDDHYDYTKVVVRKPWGYEYLIYENKDVAVWILHLRKDAATSLHCHLRKTTSLSVLSGKVICSTIRSEHQRSAGQGMLIGGAVFHSTRAISEGGAFVMEIESPVNKRDLVRYRDAYGRAGKGYESAEHFTVNVANYNYISFANSAVYYDTRKRFEDTCIRIVQAEQTCELRTLLAGSKVDLVGVLSGSLSLQDETKTAGAMFSPNDGNSSAICPAHFAAVLVGTGDRQVRAADFIIAHLQSRGIQAFFFCPGTSNAHLVDAVAREPDANYIAQASDLGAAQAALVHAKITGKPACCILSTGAAASAALTVASDAWTDSAPVIFLSAQSCLSSVAAQGSRNGRQSANKDLRICEMASPVCKYAAQVSNSSSLRAELDKALYLSAEGRPGPVWIDLPIDVLGMSIDDKMQSFFLPPAPNHKHSQSEIDLKLPKVLSALSSAKRPVLLVGHGIRIAHAEAELLALAARLGMPVLTSRRGADLLGDSHPLYFGRPGTYGHRAANFVLQNADLLLTVGSRLSLPLTGRNLKAFAPRSYKIHVDIDHGELSRPGIDSDVQIRADAGAFIRSFNEAMQDQDMPDWSAWVTRCAEWKRRYPAGGESPVSAEKGIDPYKAVELLSTKLGANAIVLPEGGPCLDFVMQSFQVKQGQRIICSSGLETEGFSIPGSIGAYVASKGSSRIVCLCGASACLSSLPDLGTLLERALPVTVIVMGSHSDNTTRSMQASYFGGRIVERPSQEQATHRALAMMASLHQTPFVHAESIDQFAEALPTLLNGTGPVLCFVRMPADHEMAPRILHTVTEDGRWDSRPLEDMFPLLSRSELAEQMKDSLPTGQQT